MKQENISNDNGNSKLFCIKLELWQDHLEFNPTLSDENNKNSFMQMIKTLIEDICSVSYQIDRIVQPKTDTTLATRTYKSKLF